MCDLGQNMPALDGGLGPVDSWSIEATGGEARNLPPLPGEVDFAMGAGVAMTGLTA